MIRQLKAIAAILVLLASLFGVQGTPQARAAAPAMWQAVQNGVNNAAAQGITQYVHVIDRQTGQELAWSSNAFQQVASESIVKLHIAAYWLGRNDGNAAAAPCDMWSMIARSHDGAASACWRNDIMPTVRSWYGLRHSENNWTNPGYWGATPISAADTSWLLWHSLRDQKIGPWLSSAMRSATAVGADGHWQDFGFWMVSGAGSKQGWGWDSYWVGPAAVHSVGFTDRYVAAVLNTGPNWTYGAMDEAATYTAQQIAAVQTVPEGVSGLVAEKWLATGGALGAPTGSYTCGLVRGGCYQFFANGRVMVVDGRAHIITDPIAQSWAAAGFEYGTFGYPIADQRSQLRGWQYQDFERGALLLSPWGAVYPSVNGPIRAAWGASGWGWSPVGNPTSPIHGGLREGGAWQSYEFGRIMAIPAGSAHLMYGPLLDAWTNRGFEHGRYGFPASNPADQVRGWRYQDFQGGSLLLSPWGVVYDSPNGAIRNAWGASGWGWSPVGNPTGTVYGGLRDGWSWQPYESGRIMGAPDGRAFLIYGAIRAEWQRQGFESGPLGYPTSNEQCDAQGCTQYFEGGALRWANGGITTIGRAVDPRTGDPRTAEQGSEPSPSAGVEPSVPPMTSTEPPASASAPADPSAPNTPLESPSSGARSEPAPTPGPTSAPASSSSVTESAAPGTASAEPTSSQPTTTGSA